LDDADSAHLAFDDDAVHIAIKVRETLLGPVDVPSSMITYCIETILDWLNETFDRVIQYPDLATLVASHPTVRH
jgi:hypothetical protein